MQRTTVLVLSLAALAALAAAQPGTLKWRYSTGANTGVTEGGVALGSDGTIYSPGYSPGSSGIIALNPNGSLKWQYDAGTVSRYAPTFVVTHAGLAVVFGAGRYVHAVNLDGSRLWRSPQLADDVNSSAAVYFQHLLVCTDNNTLHCLDLGTGSGFWQRALDGRSRTSPVIGADGRSYVSAMDNYVYCTSITGTPQWRRALEYVGISTPAIDADGTIYVGGYDGVFYAIKPDGGNRWTHRLGPRDDLAFYSSPAIGPDGTIYIGSVDCGTGGEDGHLNAYNPNGTVKWRYRVPGVGGYLQWGVASPAVAANGTVYFGAQDSCIYAVNPNGTLKWKYKTSGRIRVGAPCIGIDGTVYAGASDGYLYAINGDSRLASSPWPRFQHDNQNSGWVSGGGVEEDPVGAEPWAFLALSGRPEPFRRRTTLNYSLPQPGPVSLRVYDATGRCVRTLVAGRQDQGGHSVAWDGADDRGADVGGGVFVCRLEAGTASATRKLVKAE